MNQIFCEYAPLDQLVPVLRWVSEGYVAERNDGGEFGNWCHRVGVAT